MPNPGPGTGHGAGHVGGSALFTIMNTLSQTLSGLGFRGQRADDLTAELTRLLLALLELALSRGTRSKRQQTELSWIGFLPFLTYGRGMSHFSLQSHFSTSVTISTAASTQARAYQQSGGAAPGGGGSVNLSA